MSRSSIFVVLASALLAACGSSTNGDGAPGSPPPSDGGGNNTDGGVASDGGDDGGGGSIDAGATPTLVTEPDQGMQPIYDFVSSAKKTLDMTMYELTDTTFTGLLTTAAANGITVRVILDQNDEMKDNTAAYNTLSAAKVQVHWANPTYACTHQKSITVDGVVSAVMTLNLASDDYKTSRDFAVITANAADVAAIESTFDSDFTNAAVTPPTGNDLVWSPTNSEGALVGLIKGAKTSLLVENEEMSDETIVNELIDAAQRGVAVHVAMENSTSYTDDFAALVTDGVKLSTYEHAALYIHAKVILADYGTSTAQVFIGSENFSNASLTENRELGLITSDPGVMASINTTLTSDFSGGTPYPVAGASDAGTPGDAGSAADASGTPDAGTPDDAASGVSG